MQTTNRNLNINSSYDLQSTDSTTSIPNPKTKAEIAEFIKGQILKGEILDLRDCDIRLLLSDGTILKGAIDRSIPLIIGEHATFVVEQTTDKLLLRLQPQDSNKGFDATVDKALEEAMLPKNEKNITIVNNQIFIVIQIAFPWDFYKNIDNWLCPYSRDCRTSYMAYSCFIRKYIF